MVLDVAVFRNRVNYPIHLAGNGLRLMLTDGA